MNYSVKTRPVKKTMKSESRYITKKNTSQAKAETLHRRAVRNSKYAMTPLPDEMNAVSETF